MEKVIIFGRGRYFRKKYDRTRYEIVGFLDNAVKGQEYSVEFGCEVYHPKVWNKLPEYPILCMSVHFLEMWKQLICLGVPTERIILGICIEPFYYDYEKILFSDGGHIKIAEETLAYISKDKEVFPFDTNEKFQEIIRKKVKKSYQEIISFRKFKVEPVSRTFGAERGKAVDRVYIEKFLDENKKYIKGTVMEIESDDYIKKFGGNHVDREIILHVKGWGGKNVIKGDFETGEGVQENMVDCLICTQTLQYIYDLKKAAHNIYKILKSNGIALIKVPGIKSLSQYHDENWGEQWSFTERSVARIFSDEFGKEQVEVFSYGNVKVAMAFLYGLCKEDLEEEDFGYCDKQFPFIIAARVIKRQK